MRPGFVNIDHDTPLLLPPDLRDWVPENHLVHFIMDAVEQLDLSAARVNERGTGDEQYPPGMMPEVLSLPKGSGGCSTASRRGCFPAVKSSGRPELASFSLLSTASKFALRSSPTGC